MQRPWNDGSLGVRTFWIDLISDICRAWFDHSRELSLLWREQQPILPIVYYMDIVEVTVSVWKDTLSMTLWMRTNCFHVEFTWWHDIVQKEIWVYAYTDGELHIVNFDHGLLNLSWNIGIPQLLKSYEILSINFPDRWLPEVPGVSLWRLLKEWMQFGFCTAGLRISILPAIK